MSSVRERTQKEIVDYIRVHSKDGQLTKSLVEIAKDIGYSNATVHRALHALEQKGLVEIIPSEKPVEPNTILYKGSKNEIDEFLAKGVQLAEEMDSLGKRVNDFMAEATLLFRRAEEIERESEHSFESRIVQIQDIPGSDLQQVIVRKVPQNQ